MKQFILTLALLITLSAHAGIDPYTYAGGKVHLRGKLSTSNPEKTAIPNMTVFYFDDQILRRNMITPVNVAANGFFEADIAVPHPLFTWTRDFDGKVFFLPGDTLEIEADVATKQLKILKSDAAKRLADISSQENALMQNLKPGWYFAGCSVAEVQAYVDTIMMRIDNHLTSTTIPTYTDTVSAHEMLVREIERLASVSHALSQVLMARMYFDVPDTASVKPDYSSIARIMSKHAETLTENPAVVLCSNDADMILNYLEYREYAPLLNIWPASRNKRPDDDIKFDGVVTYPWILPEDYSAEAHEAYRYAFNNKEYNYGIAYDNALRKIETQNGLQRNSLLSQIILARYLACILRDEFDSSTPVCNYARGSVFASTMHHFSNTTIANKIINQFRELVRKYEGEDVVVNQIPEALSEIIKPYKGNLLYVDFWGMGCGPCRAGMLNQRELIREMEGKLVKFLYVACEHDSPKEPSEKWMNKNGIKGEHIFITANKWKELNAALNFNAIPFSILIDPDQKKWEKADYDLYQEIPLRLGITK